MLQSFCVEGSALENQISPALNCPASKSIVESKAPCLCLMSLNHDSLKN